MFLVTVGVLYGNFHRTGSEDPLQETRDSTVYRFNLLCETGRRS